MHVDVEQSISALTFKELEDQLCHCEPLPLLDLTKMKSQLGRKDKQIELLKLIVTHLAHQLKTLKNQKPFEKEEDLVIYKELDAVKKDNATLHQELELAKKKLLTVQTTDQPKDSSSVHHENRLLKQSLASLHQEIVQLKTNNASIEPSQNFLQQLKDKDHKLTALQELFNQKVKIQEEQMGKKETEFLCLKEQSEQEKQLLIRALSERNAFETAHLKLQSEKHLLQEQIQALQENALQTQGELEKLKREYEKTHTRLEEFALLRIELEQELQDKKQLLSELEQRFHLLESDATHYHEELQKASIQIENLYKEKAALEEISDQKKLLDSQYQELLKSHHHVLNKLENALESQLSSQHKINQLEADLAACRLTVEEQQQRLEKEERLVEELRHTLYTQEQTQAEESETLQQTQQHLAKKIRDNALLTKDLEEQKVLIYQLEQEKLSLHKDLESSQAKHIEESQKEQELQKIIQEQLLALRTQNSQWEDKAKKVSLDLAAIEKKMSEMEEYKHKYLTLAQMFTQLQSLNQPLTPSPFKESFTIGIPSTESRVVMQTQPLQSSISDNDPHSPIRSHDSTFFENGSLNTPKSRFNLFE